MSQSDFGTIVAATKSGTALASDLNAWRTALHSLHSGSSRPSYAIGGTMWLDTTGTPWLVKMYDGAADITLYAINASTDIADIVRFSSQTIALASQLQARTNISAALKGHINGLVLTNNGTDAANDIDVAAGEAASTETSPVLMILAATLTKRIDAAWAVGSGNGGIDTGSVSNTTYFMWQIRRSDTGVVDALFSLSSTSPTMPANYDQKRLIGKFARVSATNKAPRSYSDLEVTEWVAYTPTFTGFGTVAGVSVWSRRVGDSLNIRGRFAAGTVTAVEAQMTLGFNGTNSNVVSDATKVPNIQQAGVGAFGFATANQPRTLIESAIGYLTFGTQDAAASGMAKATGAGFITNSGTLIFQAETPIAGW